MAVSDPTGSETRSELADWIEISSIVAAARSVGSAELRRLLSRELDDDHGVNLDPESGEPLDIETLEEESGFIEDSVVQELEFRRDVLGDAYPFELHSDRGTWRVSLRDGEAPGRGVYLACLFISGMRDRRIPEATMRARSGVDPARVFQALADLAARRFLGEGISFGWPRPDGTPFRDALRGFADQLGVGQPKDLPPASSQRREKDEGIDVIAWRSFADKRPGHLLMLGQVASGGNWRGKPVSSEIGTFLDWFHTRPAEHAVEAMFIPFPQHHDCPSSFENGWDEVVVDFCRRNEITYGLIFDRLRITELAREQVMPTDVVAWVAGATAAAAEAA